MITNKGVVNSTKSTIGGVPLLDADFQYEVKQGNSGGGIYADPNGEVLLGILIGNNSMAPGGSPRTGIFHPVSVVRSFFEESFGPVEQFDAPAKPIPAVPGPDQQPADDTPAVGETELAKQLAELRKLQAEQEQLAKLQKETQAAFEALQKKQAEEATAAVIEAESDESNTNKPVDSTGTSEVAEPASPAASFSLVSTIAKVSGLTPQGQAATLAFTLATGAGAWMWKRRKKRKPDLLTQVEQRTQQRGGQPQSAAPFPREVDEARELSEIAQLGEGTHTRVRFVYGKGVRRRDQPR